MTFSRVGRWVRRFVFLLVVILIAPLIASAVVHGRNGMHWSDARHEPTNKAPDPAETREAVVQAYAARTWGWRGAFGVHTWIAVKPEGASSYVRLEVIGWNMRRGMSVVTVREGGPDNQWFGSDPELLVDHRGEKAAKMIPKIFAAAKAYPYPNHYRVWPGPNSNTFIAFIARDVPEMRLELSPLAVGKDYFPKGGLAGAAPSGTGYQISLYGLLGLMVAAEEGLEVNLLGLTFGIDPKDLAIKLPGLGSLSPLP